MRLPTFILSLLLLVSAGCACPGVAPTESGTLLQSPETGELSSDDTENLVPIDGATVTLYEDGEVLDVFTTDSTGYYEVGYGDACADRGALEVEFQADGHEPLRLDFQDGSRWIGLAQE